MKSLTPFLTFALVLGGCGPVFYSPSSQHAPLLTEKNEWAVSGGYVGAESAEGVALKAAYAFSPNWAVMAGGNLYFGGEDGNSAQSGSGGFAEAGAGYFQKVSKKFVFETYGLLSYGGMDNHFPQSVADHPHTNGRIKADVWGVGIQSSFGFKSRFFEAALSLKANRINYRNIRGSLITQNSAQETVGSQQAYLSDHRNHLLLEPALTLRGGWEYIKLQLQTGVSLNLSHRNFPQDASWISLGLMYRPTDRSGSSF